MSTRPLLIDDIRSTTDGEMQRLAARFTHEDRVWDLWFESRGAALTDRADPFVPIATLMGMFLGAPVEIDGPVSPRLRRNTDEFQEVFATWYGLRPVPIRAAMLVDERAVADPSRGRGAFFSGGADSFYTAITLREALTHLVFVIGFDVPVAGTALANLVLASIRAAAAELGKPLIEVRTNLRELTDPIAKWDRHAYGQALASVALALAPALRTVYVSSDVTYDYLPPNGSHPLTDPLWSTEATAIVHYGANRGKGDKYEAIGRDPVVLDHLRVCWRNPGDTYNCGRCRKCLRARAALAAIGTLERARTLPPRLTARELWRIATLDIPSPPVYALSKSVAALADRRGAAWPLRVALHLSASPKRERVQNAAAAIAGLPPRLLRAIKRRLTTR